MKISYINSICIKNDAISNSIRDELQWLQPHHDVRFFTYSCDNPELPFTRVSCEADILFDAHFQQSDLIVFHFGIFYPLFNILLATPRQAKKMVVFHNVTPKEHAPTSAHDVIERSLVQISNIAFADHAACDSGTNLDVLRQAGIKTPATVLPLAVHNDMECPATKPGFSDNTTRIAFVGRFVQSKGPDEVLTAVQNVLQCRPDDKIILDMIGNLNFSDVQMVASVRTMMKTMKSTYGNRLTVNLHGDASEELKNRVLTHADIFMLPTRHEGFCVTIVEALAAACRVITYDNSNTPSISGGLAELVPTADVTALSQALLHTVEQVRSPDWTANGGYQHYSKLATAHVSQFRVPEVRRRFLDFVSNIAANGDSGREND